jgi:hypothetical protein
VGLDAVGGVHLTTQPGPHARPSSLHPRLTVALALEADRARVAEALPGVVVRADDLWRAADELAADRSGDRAATRSRLDAVAARALHDLETARSQREHLDASQRGLLEGATWALELQVDLAELHEAAETARATLEQRLAEQRSAQQLLERVLEQRAAAAAAIEEADAELSELVGVGMDESGLRRELEASGHAVRSAQAVHSAALDRVRALQAQQAELAAQVAELQGGTLGEARDGSADPRLVEHVRSWLASWVAEAGEGGLDPQAQALADAWGDLLADLAELAPQAVRPSDAELVEAEARVARAAQELERLAGSARSLDAASRAELDAAHEAVQAAEERCDRRIGAAAARRKLAQALVHESELLARHGFESYLDVVLSGGRTTAGATERLAAERAYLAATNERDALLAALRPSPEIEYLGSERARLHAHAVDLLGVDPGNDPVGLLRAHPLLPTTVVEGLRDALAEAGVAPVGVDLATAAARFLAQQDAAALERDRHRAAGDQISAQLEALAARQAEVARDLVAAEVAEATAAEQLELAGRSVGAFEAELSMRAGEDAQRLPRLVAAEQLRSQVEALAATLTRAEDDARQTLELAVSRSAEAEVAADRTASTLADHTRRARRLAAELPIDQRPDGDPLATLTVLADRLQTHAVVLEPEIQAAEQAVAAASDQLDAALAVAQAASTGLEGPLAEDLQDALAGVLAGHVDRLIVLDEPFSGVDEQVRTTLLSVVRDRSATGSLVLLTEDADVLSWAIELPLDIATTVPAGTLLSAAERIAQHLPETAPQPTNADSATPTTSAPRWAGQR